MLSVEQRIINILILCRAEEGEGSNGGRRISLEEWEGSNCWGSLLCTKNQPTSVQTSPGTRMCRGTWWTCWEGSTWIGDEVWTLIRIVCCYWRNSRCWCRSFGWSWTRAWWWARPIIKQWRHVIRNTFSRFQQIFLLDPSSNILLKLIDFENSFSSKQTRHSIKSSTFFSVDHAK